MKWFNECKTPEDVKPMYNSVGLSSGTFIGMVADNSDEKIELKLIHSEIQNDHAAIKEKKNNL